MNKIKNKDWFRPSGIPWLKYTKLYYSFSAIFIIAGILGIISWGLPLGLDFTGGAVIDYEVTDPRKRDALEDRFREAEIEIAQIQTSGADRIIVKTRSLSEEEQKKIAGFSSELEINQLQIQNVGPTVGPELIKKTIIAIVIAATAILLWVATQFKKIAFGVSAIVAMLHDTFILIGVFSIFGHFADAEIDFLFVTAVLTTLSFSVHDTIVVFDRIREIQKKHGGELVNVANRATSETMRRSIINSLTIIIMLLSLTILGGDSIRWFSGALLIGAIAGTYSSPFVAVPLFVTLSKMQLRFKRK
jgi:preprotein translocase subunit SecF